MSVRTCLLCGKPLGRIWVGAGEDFCSREHRNQYKLRRGMDRLEESSKVASLMRRREHPKPIPDLYQAGDCEPRMADSSQVRITAQRSSLMLPASRWTPGVRLPGSRGWIERYEQGISEGAPRDFGVPKPKKPRVISKEVSWRQDAAAGNFLQKHKRPREVRGSTKTGKALRVSSSAGFRLPAKRSLDFHTATQRPAMIWPSRLRQRTLEKLDSPSAYTVPKMRFGLPLMELPTSPVPARPTALVAREALTHKSRVLSSLQPLSVQRFDNQWTPFEQATPRPIPYSERKMAMPLFVGLPQEQRDCEATSHLVLVPLLPEDRAFNYIPAIVVSPAGMSGVPKPKAILEEQFDAGLRNWTGGVDDWVLDAAGARTGSLALFTPTLDKRDYELEFLARIDHHSVTWVFRATNLNDYHLATIQIGQDGSFAFRRGIVMGSKNELSDPAPINMALNKKNAVTVKLKATGNEFSVWVEGQAIETWTDNRLPSGGIGFLGASDDRARIYWVRLSPLGSPGKEYSRR